MNNNDVMDNECPPYSPSLAAQQKTQESYGFVGSMYQIKSKITLLHLASPAMQEIGKRNNI